MKISLIAALDEANGIGAGNKLVWHLPDDFKWFKKHTVGKPMLMGRNTMLSLGKALPNRLNLVISSTDNAIIEGFQHVHSLQEAKLLRPDGTVELMVIGGGMLYKHLLPEADRLYITRIHNTYEGMDTFFPEWIDSEWKEIYFEHHSSDERHQFSFDFIILDRILSAKNEN